MYKVTENDQINTVYNLKQFKTIKETSYQKINLRIRYLWQRGMDSIHDMHAVNTSILSHQNKSPEKCLLTAEKKRKYLEDCLRQRLHFLIFVNSMDGLLGVQAEDVLKCIVSLPTKKWGRIYLSTGAYVNSRVSITLVRATHH